MTLKDLRDELAAAQHSSEAWQSKYDKLEKEFCKLQEFATKTQGQNRNLKQVIQQLGEVITHL